MTFFCNNLTISSKKSEKTEKFCTAKIVEPFVHSGNGYLAIVGAEEETENPRLILKSSFKSRAGYKGARTVYYQRKIRKLKNYINDNVLQKKFNPLPTVAMAI